jgi:hypothetical protein
MLEGIKGMVLAAVVCLAANCMCPQGSYSSSCILTQLLHYQMGCAECCHESQACGSVTCESVLQCYISELVRCATYPKESRGFWESSSSPVQHSFATWCYIGYHRHELGRFGWCVTSPLCLAACVLPEQWSVAAAYSYSCCLYGMADVI